MLPSGLPEAVENDEPLARFLTSSRQFNSTMARPAAFLPNKKKGTLSTCRHGPDPLTKLQELGREYFHGQENVRVHGAAIVLTRHVLAIDPLRVEASEPPTRHADIAGWIRSAHANEPRWEKADNLHLATAIARQADLVRW